MISFPSASYAAQARAARRSLKEGRLKKAPFAGARVLGVPSLSRRHASLWESEELLSLIRDIGSQSPFLCL